MNNPLLGYSSDRYGSVDRERLGQESRTNSLTAERLNELSSGGAGPGYNGGYPTMTRRSSQSPGNPLSPGPGPRPGGRPSPPNGYTPNGIAPNGMPSHGMHPSGMHPNGMQPNGMQPNGMHPNGMHPHGAHNGRPSPPGMRQPVPRHPPGHGNAVAPHQIEQHTGVSNLYPPKKSPQVRSLTGSASASAESGDSGASAHLDSEPSAHSSSSSLGPRPPFGVR
ncbi:hypothetical protein LTS18_009794 [Coniosporium uncinatum]|uniref:Uncharacterized protein n=1 Tax=Coniosporium uncinatum TaxID=93489 RepID=A0ACC3D0F0_9PEZI|nr:hypothetical protein LTS18_009794 [Coniosporium uncinatum]